MFPLHSSTTNPSSSSSSSSFTFLMSFNAPRQPQQQQQHSESPMRLREQDEDANDTTVGGVCNLVSRESLEALGFGSENNDKGGYLPPSKSCNSLTASSEESTLALTDCSSRSSLQDLDLSFEDALPSPALGYWKEGVEGDDDDDDDIVLRKDGAGSRHPFLPSVLRKPPQAPRVVSFSSVQEVFGEEEEQRGIRPPKTPTIEWYAARGSSQKLHQNRYPVPLYSSSPSRKAPPHLSRQQPRRSALKKPDSWKTTREFVQPLLHYPTSPKVTWYSSSAKK